jgi:CheY-like chemotaxis protein
MIINRALDCTKVSHNIPLSPRLETLNPTLLVHDVVRGCLCLADESPVVMETNVGLIPSSIVTDQDWFTENLLCLVTNAQKYNIPEHGSPTVRLSLVTPEECFHPMFSSSHSLNPTHTMSKVTKISSVTDMLLVEVRDRGRGIEPQNHHLLFRPFKQSEKEAGGSGLGLYALALRLTALEGLYGYYSRDDGLSGSCFWFALPISQQVGLLQFGKDFLSPDSSNQLATHTHPYNRAGEDLSESIRGRTGPIDRLSVRDRNEGVSSYRRAPNRPAAVVTPSNDTIASQPTKLRMLVVDDSIFILKTSKKMLLREGHLVDVAKNGEECIEAFRTKQYDVILMDIQMPVMDGLEAAHLIREIERANMMADDPPLSTVPICIIGVSANTLATAMHDAIKAGMDDFLTKPLSISQLRGVLDRISSRRGGYSNV